MTADVRASNHDYAGSTLVKRVDAAAVAYARLLIAWTISGRCCKDDVVAVGNDADDLPAMHLSSIPGERGTVLQ